MGGRSGIVVLAILCVVLSCITFFAVDRRDTTAPVISFEKKSIYYDGEDTSTLLDGVSALDDRDGDVTESIIISSVYRLTDKTGVVIYAAKDAANNVATLGRGFFYQGYDTSGLFGLSSDSGEASAESAEEGAEPDNGTEGVEPENSGEMTEEDYKRLKEENLSQGIPFVKLLQHEATIEKGSSFNIYRYIDEVVDDADTISTMLRIEGNVDTMVPGTYEVSVFAKDSDENESNVEKIVITVE